MNFKEYFLRESEHKVIESGFYAIFVNTRVTCVNLTDKEHVDYYELRNVYDKANNSEYIFPSTRKCSAQVAQDFALSKFRELHPDLYNKRFVKKVKETFAPFIIENDDVYEWRVYFSEDYEGIIALAEIDSVSRKQKAVNHALSQIKNNPDVSRLFNRSIITTESKESLLSLLTDDQTCLTFTILPYFATKLVPLSVCRDLEKAGIGKEEWEIESMRVEFSTVERLCIHAIKHINSTVRREDILKVVKDYLDELKNIPGQFFARRSGTGLVIAFTVDLLHFKQYKAGNALAAVKDNTEVNKLFKRKNINESVLDNITDHRKCLTFTIFPNYESKLIPISVCHGPLWAGVGGDEDEMEDGKIDFDAAEHYCLHAISRIASPAKRAETYNIVKGYLDELKNIPGQFYAKRTGVGLVIAFDIDIMYFKQYKAGNALTAVKDNAEVSKLFKRKNINESLLGVIGEYERYSFSIQPRCEGFDKIHIFDPYNDSNKIDGYWKAIPRDQVESICMKYILKIPFVRAQDAAIEHLNKIINTFNSIPGSYYYRVTVSSGRHGDELIVMFVVDDQYLKRIKVNKALNSVKDNAEVNKLFKK